MASGWFYPVGYSVESWSLHSHMDLEGGHMLLTYLIIALVVFMFLLVLSFEDLAVPTTHKVDVWILLGTLMFFSLSWPLTVTAYCWFWIVDYFWPGFWDDLFLR